MNDARFQVVVHGGDSRRFWVAREHADKYRDRIEAWSPAQVQTYTYTPLDQRLQRLIDTTSAPIQVVKR